MIDGKPSHGTLLDPALLSNIVNAGALLQIASIALGQKHLADIKRELDEIKGYVKSISEFQQNERLSRLTATIKYLDQVAPSVLDGDAPTMLAAQLESHEAKLLAIQQHLFEDIKARTNDILNLKDPATFGSEGMQKAIERHHGILATHYEHALLCIRARAANLQLASMVSLDERIKDARLADIRESLEALRKGGNLIRATDKLMRQKIRTLSSMTNKSTTVTQRKLDLLRLNEALVAKVTSSQEEIHQNLRATEGFFRRQTEPVKLLLRVEGNYIVGIQPT